MERNGQMQVGMEKMGPVEMEKMGPVEMEKMGPVEMEKMGPRVNPGLLPSVEEKRQATGQAWG
jgi:hypothetical protein